MQGGLKPQCLSQELDGGNPKQAGKHVEVGDPKVCLATQEIRDEAVPDTRLPFQRTEGTFLSAKPLHQERAQSRG